MMSTRILAVTALAGAALLAAACSDGSGGVDGTTLKADEDERGSVGVPPTAAEYCAKLGFTAMNSQCTFPDGTSCDQWAFYRGECGAARSYCNQHGGAITSKTEDMGGWTAVYGVCTLNGKTCKESSFIQTGKCEAL
ncbi:MAG: DUF333 domain-containing protein [Deltaproteobacteria bacterium]|nr:DUF333 domain-containing protein [Deltaproteobacteria bacterium]